MESAAERMESVKEKPVEFMAVNQGEKTEGGRIEKRDNWKGEVEQMKRTATGEKKKALKCLEHHGIAVHVSLWFEVQKKEKKTREGVYTPSHRTPIGWGKVLSRSIFLRI